MQAGQKRLEVHHASQHRSFVSIHHFKTGEGDEVIPIRESETWPPNYVALVLRDNRGEKEDADKYAALFSAAPDLLAALIELVSGHSMAGEEMARKAIAKATGGAQ